MSNGYWVSKDGLRIPKADNALRVKWDADYVQRVHDYFGDPSRELVPALIPVHKALGGHGATVDNHRGAFYVKLLKLGERLPPIVVSEMGNGNYNVLDGNHRIAAAQAAGVTHLPGLVIRDKATAAKKPKSSPHVYTATSAKKLGSKKMKKSEPTDIFDLSKHDREVPPPLPKRIARALWAIRQPGVLTDELRAPQYRSDPNPVAGHCFVATNALFHLIDGARTGWEMKCIHREHLKDLGDDTHWFLQHKKTGNILDPTVDQFEGNDVPYDKAVGKGTSQTGDDVGKPTKRASIVINRAKDLLEERPKEYLGTLEHDGEQWYVKPPEEKLGKSEDGRVWRAFEVEESDEPLAKMSMVHDDAKNPRTVYRIQNDMGEGPYRSGDEGEFSAVSTYIPYREQRYTHAHLSGQNPPPHGDFPSKDIANAGLRGGHGSGVLFGFTSPEAALRWFGDKGISTLANYGFHLTEVPAAKVWESDSKTQAMFHPASAVASFEPAKRFNWAQYLASRATRQAWPALAAPATTRRRRTQLLAPTSQTAFNFPTGEEGVAAHDMRKAAGKFDLTDEEAGVRPGNQRLSFDDAHKLYDWFHLSYEPPDETGVFAARPYIPKNSMMGEDTKTKRICVGPSLHHCMAGILGNSVLGEDDRDADDLLEDPADLVAQNPALIHQFRGMHVYGVPKRSKVTIPHEGQVPDAPRTGEGWLTRPTKLQHLGQIHAPADFDEQTGRTTPTAEPHLVKAEQSPEFQSWFAGSKAVDPEGKPLRFFHGTSKDQDFHTFKAGQRGAWFTDDPEEASLYAQSNDSQKHVLDRSTLQFVPKHTAPRVIPVHLSIKNPYTPSLDEFKALKWAPNYAIAQREMFNKARMAGHDGANMGAGIWVAFNPNQIKSVFNTKPTQNPAIHKAEPKLSTGGLRFKSPDGKSEEWDYSHLLPEKTRQEGYRVKVRVFNNERPSTWDSMGPNFANQTRNRIQVFATKSQAGRTRPAGELVGSWKDKTVEPWESRVEEQDRRKRIGLSMYEALYAHSRAHLGATQVSGDYHSTAAHLVHKKLAARHALNYEAKPNVGRQKAYTDMAEWRETPPHDSDAKYSGYKYKLPDVTKPKEVNSFAEHRLPGALDAEGYKLNIAHSPDGAIGTIHRNGRVIGHIELTPDGHPFEEWTGEGDREGLREAALMVLRGHQDGEMKRDEWNGISRGAPQPMAKAIPDSQPAPSFEEGPAQGSHITQPHQTYTHGAAAKPFGTEHEGGKNVWGRNHPGKSNAGRTLMVQFSTHLLQGGRQRDASDDYYDKLYSKREGYHRGQDWWEVPQWQAHLAHSMPDADHYTVRDPEEAIRFMNAAGYKHVAFSALDVNKDFVKRLAEGSPGQHVVVGGYTDMNHFAGLPNVSVHPSIQSFVEGEGREYKPGYDYRHFTGTKVLPRLTLSDGCRHNCTFCCVPKQVDEKTREEILQQADSFAEHLPSDLIYLNDKTYGQAANHAMLPELYQRIKAKNPAFKGFVIQTTAAQMKRFTPEFIRQAGIKHIELGIESVNDPILKAHKKPANEALIEEAANKVRAAGASLIPNIMVGLPGEDRTTYGRTMAWLQKHRDIISHVNTYNLALYDDSELGKKLQVINAGDRDENVQAKSWHTDPQAHKDFADALTQFASAQLDQPIGHTPLTKMATVYGKPAPQYDPTHEYLSGLCAEHAIAHHEATGYPLYAIRGHYVDPVMGDETHEDAHFVTSPDGGKTAFDARGRAPMKHMLRDARFSNDVSRVAAVPVSRKDIEDNWSVDEGSLAQARKFVASKHLGKSEVDPHEPAAATVMVQDGLGRTLWGKRRKDGKYTLPGGHLDRGEAPAAAAVRELYEEAGLVPETMWYLGAGNGPEGPVYVYHCIARGQPTSVNDPDREMASWEWADCLMGPPPHITANLAHNPNVVYDLMGWQQPQPMVKSEGEHDLSAMVKGS